MRIRNYQPGDEESQASLYNECAAALPKFKPAAADEVRRRCQAPDFDPSTRLFAEDGGRVVGYLSFAMSGRVGFPWTLPNHKGAAEALLDRALSDLRARGVNQTFAAYRGDWPSVADFFQSHGFRRTREVLNYVLDQVDMPTSPFARRNPLSPLRSEDMAAVLEMGRGVVRARTAAEMDASLLQNPLLPARSVFGIRDRATAAPIAAGVLVSNPAYADPHQLDADAPCFRLGAFGSEGMSVKRVNGLFSFLVADPGAANDLALDLLGHATFQFRDSATGALAAQVASDAGPLIGFYDRYFRRQGGFPLFERDI